MTQGDGSQEAAIIIEQLGYLVVTIGNALTSLIIRELDTLLKQEDVKKKLDELSIYIAIEILLALACMDVTVEEVSNILEKLDVEPENRLLNMIYPFGSKNEIAHLISIYELKALNLIGVKREITTENIIKLVRSLDIIPEMKIAEEMLDFYGEFEKSNGVIEGENKQTTDPRIKSLYNLVYEYINATNFIVSKELKRWTSAAGIGAYWQLGIGCCIVAAAFLAYTGREQDKNSIVKVLEAESVNLNVMLVTALRALHIKNHIIYFVAISLLKTVGKEVSMRNIIDTVRVLSIEPDATTAQEAMEIFENAIESAHQ